MSCSAAATAVPAEDKTRSVTAASTDTGTFAAVPSTPMPTWLDVHPGHDAAIALILAGYSTQLRILGVSTVAGNQTNALRVLDVSGLGGGRIPVFNGAAKPLMRPGKSGLDGTQFPPLQEAAVTGMRAFEALRDAVRSCQAAGTPLTLIATGPLTNVALLYLTYPELFTPSAIRQIVLMGGAIGVGNTNPAAEFNIERDPEAASLVFEQAARVEGVAVVMVPLEVPHTALVTEQVLADVRAICSTTTADAEHATSIFATLICELLLFFNETYASVFGFESPPLHDPCAVFYALRPDLFVTRRMRVDVECGSALCAGRTVCDIYGRSSKPSNVTVALSMDVPAFWRSMMQALHDANQHSRLNVPAVGNTKGAAAASQEVHAATQTAESLLSEDATITAGALQPQAAAAEPLALSVDDDADMEEGEIRPQHMDANSARPSTWPAPPLLRGFRTDPLLWCVAMVAGKPVGAHAQSDLPIACALRHKVDRERCAEFTAVLTFTGETEPMELASEVVRQLQSRQVLTAEQEQQLEWIRFGSIVHGVKQYYLSFHTAAACRQFVQQLANRASCGFKIAGLFGHGFKVPSKAHPIFGAAGSQPSTPPTYTSTAAAAGGVHPSSPSAAAASSSHSVRSSSKRSSSGPPSSYQFHFDEPLLPGLHVSAEGVVENRLRDVHVDQSQVSIRHRMMLTLPMPATGRPHTDEQWLSLLQSVANRLHKRMIVRYAHLEWLAPLADENDTACRITLALQVRPRLKAFYIIINSPQLRQTGWQASAYASWLLHHLRTHFAEAASFRFCEEAFVHLGNGEYAATAQCPGSATCKFSHNCDMLDELIQMRKQAVLDRQALLQQPIQGAATDTATSSRASHTRSRSPNGQQARSRSRSRSRERDTLRGLAGE